MAINSGISTLGNRTFFFGGASGIDTSSLIKVAYQQRRSEADKLDIKVKTNTAKFEAFEKMRNLANDVRTSLGNVKKNYSILGTNQSLFDSRSGTLTSTSATNANNLVSVAIDPATNIGNYSIEAVSKARSHKVASNSTFTDKNADLNLAGTFDIAIAGKTAGTVNVTADMSLAELATAINSQASTTGVNASVVQKTATTFQLVLSGADTAKSISITNVTGTNVMQSIGVTDAGGAYANSIQTAQQAEIKIDGVSYVRDTNNFDGIVAGVKLSLKNAEPGTKIDLSIGNDTSGIKEGIQKFVESYNALRSFIKQQQVVSAKGEVDASAILYGDGVLNNINLSLQKSLGATYGTGGTSLGSLGELGIKLDPDNKLVMDEVKFDTALIEKFDQVRSIFETKVTSDSDQLRMSKNTSSATSLAFAMDITMSGSSISSVSVGGNSSLFDISGQTITGKTGTAYEGMSFAYVGTTSKTVNITLKGGAADAVDTILSKGADILNGDITKEMQRITVGNADLSRKSAEIVQKADAYREKLVDRYASFESRLSRAQNVLTQLRGITGNKQQQ